MKLIYVDEAGNCDSKFHIVAGVCFDSKNYNQHCSILKNKLSEYGYDSILGYECKLIGLGKEIKGKAIFKQSLQRKNCKWNNLINLFLEFPIQAGSTAWLIILDREKYLKKYHNLQSAQLLCLQNLFERIQLYLKKQDNHAVCIIDQYKKFDDDLYNFHVKISNAGTYFHGSKSSNSSYAFIMDRVIEIHVGNSKNSLGLQLADFIVSGCYQYLTRNPKSKPFWISKMLKFLDRDPDTFKPRGFGLKYIP